MTATVERPARPAPPPHGPRADGPGSAPPPPADPFAPSALALAALTLVAAVGMGRLFADGTFLVPYAAAALGAHGSAWWARRAGWGVPGALLASAGAVALAVAWTVFPHTTAYGIPWMGTVDAVRQSLTEAWSQFSQVVAPAPVTKGFLMAGMAGIAVNAVLADWAAFRLRTTFEPLLPSFTLFAFTSALGAPSHRTLATAAYVGAVLVFLLVHQAALKADRTAWFASRSRGGLAALLRGGVALAGVAVVAAAAIGPNLPGAKSKALIAWRKSDHGDGRRDRVTTSPLVDIRGRLVNQADVEVFTVRSTHRAYWHLTSLDEFDGRIWSSKGTYRSVGRRLPGQVPVQAPADRVVQDFRIGLLASIWLPVAYQPERVEGIDDVSYNPDLGSLITSDETSDGLEYRVQSNMPRFEPAALDQASVEVPHQRFLQLPNLPRRVVQAAFTVTRPQPTPYLKAKALQDWFRANFTYDQQVGPGHDGNALERFLFSTRRGYCEQFAGAYAAMARAVGLPTRVAVGFTPGELGPDGLYHVRGLNAHAWPEVFLEGFGWVAFEPTPGRGRPGAEQYTGVPEMQASAQAPQTSTTLPPTTTPTTGPDGSTATTQPRDAEVDSGGGLDGETGGAAWPVRAGGVVLVLAAAWAVAVPAALRRRRQRRRSGAATGPDRVLVAWAEATEALGRVGAGKRSSETVAEYATRAPAVATLPGAAAQALAELAAQAEAASYAAVPMGADDVARAVGRADAVGASVRRGLTRRQRLLWWLDPRPLLPARTRQITLRRAPTGEPAEA